jgi:hypothetical protein
VRLWTQEVYVNATTYTQFGESGVQEAYDTTVGELFRHLQEEFGKCISKMYRDNSQVGWVFQKVMVYDDARPDHRTRAGRPVYAENDHYLREVWVEVFTRYDVETTVTAEHPFTGRRGALV